MAEVFEPNTNIINNRSHPVSKYGSPIAIPPSPVPTQRSFELGDDNDATKTLQPPLLPKSTSTPRRNIDLIMRDIEHDVGAGRPKKDEKEGVERKRSNRGVQYYDEVFGARQSPKIPQTAGICVEFKTNLEVS